MQVMYALLKPGGTMICSDFHPFTKIADILNLEQPSMSYFSLLFLRERWLTHVFTKTVSDGRCRGAATGNIPSARLSTPS